MNSLHNSLPIFMIGVGEVGVQVSFYYLDFFGGLGRGRGTDVFGSFRLLCKCLVVFFLSILL